MRRRRGILLQWRDCVLLTELVDAASLSSFKRGSVQIFPLFFLYP